MNDAFDVRKSNTESGLQTSQYSNSPTSIQLHVLTRPTDDKSKTKWSVPAPSAKQNQLTQWLFRATGNGHYKS
jgi:hypothetical protein